MKPVKLFTLLAIASFSLNVIFTGCSSGNTGTGTNLDTEAGTTGESGTENNEAIDGSGNTGTQDDDIGTGTDTDTRTDTTGGGTMDNSTNSNFSNPNSEKWNVLE